MDAPRPHDPSSTPDPAEQQAPDRIGEVPSLEVDETVPPRPEEEIADVDRETDSTPDRPTG